MCVRARVILKSLTHRHSCRVIHRYVYTDIDTHIDTDTDTDIDADTRHQHPSITHIHTPKTASDGNRATHTRTHQTLSLSITRTRTIAQKCTQMHPNTRAPTPASDGGRAMTTAAASMVGEANFVV